MSHNMDDGESGASQPASKVLSKTRGPTRRRGRRNEEETSEFVSSQSIRLTRGRVRLWLCGVAIGTEVFPHFFRGALMFYICGK